MREPRIDVHMLTLDEPAEWRDTAISSLADAPIRLHVLPGIRGDLLGARKRGIAIGDLPYVSWADPDDVYFASAFDACADALDSDPSVVMVYTAETVFSGNRAVRYNRSEYNPHLHRSNAEHVHGVIVIRREIALGAMKRIPPDPIYPEWAITQAVAMAGRVLFIDTPGRCWRQHRGQYTKSTIILPSI